MQNTRQSLTAALYIIAAVCVGMALSFSKDLFAPVISALLLGVVLSPLSDLWDRLRVPAAIAAFISVVMSLALILLLLIFLEPYVSQVIKRAPLIWIELRDTVEQFKGLLRGLEDLSEDVTKAIDAEAPNSDEAVKVPSVTDALFYAPAFAAQVMIFIGTLYFFLLARLEIYDWIGRSALPLTEQHLRYANARVSRYFLTIATINLGFGLLITMVMFAIGMPSPVLWGTLAFFVNFVLYLGPAFLGATLLVTGIVMFDGAVSFLPAALYLTLNATEGQFVTPSLVGKSMEVNPLLVFLSLVFWLWLWGPIGGIIAIPLLIWTIAILKSANDQTISSGIPSNSFPSSAAGATS